MSVIKELFMQLASLELIVFAARPVRLDLSIPAKSTSHKYLDDESKFVSEMVVRDANSS